MSFQTIREASVQEAHLFDGDDIVFEALLRLEPKDEEFLGTIVFSIRF